MSVNNLVLSTLNSLSVPVSLLKYTGDETTYVVYQTYLEQGEVFEDDEEKVTGHYILVNVFSQSSYIDLVTEIKSLMKEANFRRTNEHDLFDNDTGYHNHVLKFYYEEEL
jgi:hypothetical protein